MPVKDPPAPPGWYNCLEQSLLEQDEWERCGGGRTCDAQQVLGHVVPAVAVAALKLVRQLCEGGHRSHLYRSLSTHLHQGNMRLLPWEHSLV